MNPTLALFWKEGREAAYKIAACAGLALVVGLVYNLWEYPERIRLGTSVGTIGHFVGLIGAVLMGMDAIARERSRSTLPFLLCRPLEARKMLIVKFVVGAVGLLAILAAYWGGIFIGMPLDGSSIFGAGEFQFTFFSTKSSNPPEETLADVGYVRMLLLWFLAFLIPYSAAVPRIDPYRSSLQSRGDVSNGRVGGNSIHWDCVELGATDCGILLQAPVLHWRARSRRNSSKGV